MRMIACCFLLAALVSCEQPRPAPSAPQPAYRIAPPQKLDDVHKQHERVITDMQREIRRLRDTLEKHKEPQ